MVGRVTPVRAEIVLHRRRVPTCRGLALTSFRFNGSPAVQFRQLAPEFAFTFSQFFWDVDLGDNVQIAAFP